MAHGLWRYGVRMSSITVVKLGSRGRLVVPARLLRELGLESGAELVARAEDGRLVLEPKAAAVARLRRRFQDVQGSLAEELLAERRAEAAGE